MNTTLLKQPKALTTAQKKHQVNSGLQRIGLAKLGEPALLRQIAFLTEDHEDFRKLLTAVEPENRVACYDAMKPHLGFEAWPLDRYIAKTRELAGEEESRQLAIAAEDAITREAAKCALNLKCHKCTATESFPAFGTTQVYKDMAIMAARRKGWARGQYRDSEGEIHQIEICPKCPAKQRIILH